MGLSLQLCVMRISEFTDMGPSDSMLRMNRRVAPVMPGIKGRQPGTRLT